MGPWLYPYAGRGWFGHTHTHTHNAMWPVSDRTVSHWSKPVRGGSFKDGFVKMHENQEAAQKV